MERNFRASVQYNDYKGTSAADKADIEHVSKWLTDNNHINPDELLLGLTMSAGENHGVHRDPISVEFLVTQLGNYETLLELIESTPKPLQVRNIRVDMNLAEFFSLFKRFNITLSRMEAMNGVPYTYLE